MSVKTVSSEEFVTKAHRPANSVLDLTKAKKLGLSFQVGKRH